jgi:hypothetical protein
MSKKLILAGMALFAFAAFILPATASAANDPEITHPTGTLLNPTGKTCTGVNNAICIDAHNINPIRLKDSSGNTLTECSTSTFTGELTKNDGSNVEGNINSSSFSGTGASGECTSTFGGISVDTNIGSGTPWCIRSTAAMATDEGQVRGGKCSEALRSITFVLTSTTVGTCKYSRATALIGTYTTDTPATQDAVIHFTAAANTEFTKEEGGIFCPAAGRLEGSWTLKTDVVATEPLYFS